MFAFHFDHSRSSPPPKHSFSTFRALNSSEVSCSNSSLGSRSQIDFSCLSLVEFSRLYYNCCQKRKLIFLPTC